MKRTAPAAFLLLAMLLAGAPPAFSDEVSGYNPPALLVRARAEKAGYIVGEPVRFFVTLQNTTADSLVIGHRGGGFLYYSVVDPYGHVTFHVNPAGSFRETINGRVLAPFDSTTLIVEPDWTARLVGPTLEPGPWLRSREISAFPRPGSYITHVLLRMSTRTVAG